MIFHVHSSYIASKFFKIFIWIPYLLAAAIWSENFNFFFTINFFESKLLTFLNLFLPSCFFSGKIKLGKFEKQPQPCLMSSTVSTLSLARSKPMRASLEVSWHYAKNYREKKTWTTTQRAGLLVVVVALRSALRLLTAETQKTKQIQNRLCVQVSVRCTDYRIK